MKNITTQGRPDNNVSYLEQVMRRGGVMELAFHGATRNNTPKKESKIFVLLRSRFFF